MRNWILLVFLVLSTVALSGDYTDAAKRLASLKSPDLKAVSAALGKVGSNPDIARSVVALKSAGNHDEALNRIRQITETLAQAESARQSPDISRQVSAIKSSTFYRDSGVRESSSWLTEALKKLDELRLKNQKPREPIGALPSWLGQAFVYLMWTVIGVVVSLLLFFGFQHLAWKRSLARKAGAIIEADEPERSLDEWLELADQHAAAGRFREAVRAMYLACLLKFDESRIARFDRGQTNWEHLHRIEASPRLPEGIEFRTTTKAFDRIWYGRAATHQEDVDRFRHWYIALKSATEVRAA